jgi:hypothetical protein
MSEACQCEPCRERRGLPACGLVVVSELEAVRFNSPDAMRELLRRKAENAADTLWMQMVEKGHLPADARRRV